MMKRKIKKSRNKKLINDIFFSSNYKINLVNLSRSYHRISNENFLNRLLKGQIMLNLFCVRFVGLEAFVTDFLSHDMGILFL